MCSFTAVAVVRARQYCSFVEFHVVSEVPLCFDAGEMGLAGFHTQTQLSMSPFQNNPLNGLMSGLHIPVIIAFLGTVDFSHAQDERFKLIDSPPQIEMGVRQLIDDGESITEVVQGAYALALQVTKGASPTAAFKDVPLGRTKDVPIQCLIADRERGSDTTV